MDNTKDRPESISAKRNDESDIQPEDDYMKKENASKYKPGRAYHSSAGRDTDRPLTQDEHPQGSKDMFKEIEGAHPMSDRTDHNQNKQYMVQKQNTNSRNSSNRMSQFLTLKQESAKRKN